MTTWTSPRSSADVIREVDVLVLPLPLAEGVEAWFTGRDLSQEDPPVGRAGNLSHRRPHRPADLARERERASTAMDLDFGAVHLMRQCHGAEVAIVDATSAYGAEFDGVDVLVTAEPDRPLGVAVADCVPVLLAGRRTIAAVHAGRLGVAADAVGAALDTMRGLGEELVDVRAALGPSIGGCCYEVPADLQRRFTATHPDAAGTTTWGTPSLDLPASVRRQLDGAGITDIVQVGGCTHCDPEQRWFSHRADPGAGRQYGVIVRRRPTGSRRRSGAEDPTGAAAGPQRPSPRSSGAEAA
jgi:polyphenol oxidase